MWKINLKQIGIIFLIYCILLSLGIAGWEYKVRDYFFKKEAKIKIVKKEKLVYKYIKVPKTIQDYKDCCNDKIKIDTKIKNDNILYITAYTNWQMVNQKIKLESKAKRSWKPVIIVGGIAFTAGLALGGFAIYKIIKR